MEACISQLETLAAAPAEVVAAPTEEQAAITVTSTPSVNAVPSVPAAAHQTLSRTNSESLC